jgi:hypothetical protein
MSRLGKKLISAVKESRRAPQVGAERWRVEHVSYKAWCALARERGWNGEDDADGLRAHCEPEEAASYSLHTSLDAAKAAALATFAADPDDSAFGAIIIEHQVLEAAHDDRGNLVRGCRPEWEAVRVYEVTSDGDMQERTP